MGRKRLLSDVTENNECNNNVQAQCEMQAWKRDLIGIKNLPDDDGLYSQCNGNGIKPDPACESLQEMRNGGVPKTRKYSNHDRSYNRRNSNYPDRKVSRCNGDASVSHKISLKCETVDSTKLSPLYDRRTLLSRLRLSVLVQEDDL